MPDPIDQMMPDICPAPAAGDASAWVRFSTFKAKTTKTV